jgi:hypothetical protein
VNGQLEFEFGAELTDAEHDALVADSVAQYSNVATEARLARPCVCEHPLVFVAELGEGRCGLCGREPR